MSFTLNYPVLSLCRATLWATNNVYWLVGGAGSGKTTISQALGARYHLPVYDMDAHIYGSYHTRFTAERHPVNWAWAAAPQGLAWLLAMTWEEFHQFNRAALVEYLDLLCEDLRASPPEAGLVVDGGICNPGVLTHALPPSRVVCLANPGVSSVALWEGTAERRAMKDMVYALGLPQPAEAWQKFLDFDHAINTTLLEECQQSGVTVLTRGANELVAELTTRVAQTLGLAV